MKKLGRPKSATEKKVIVSGYVSESNFREIAKLAIANKCSISKTIDSLLDQALTLVDIKADTCRRKAMA
jgi:hypothetical protein